MGAAVRRLEYQPLDAVQRAVRNPNPHRDADVEASVRRHGFVHPMVLDERTGRLLDGHGRLDVLLAMRQAGEPPPDGVTDDWQVPVNLGWASADAAEAEALQVAMIQLPKTPVDAEHAPTLAAMLDDIASNTAAGLDGTGFNADSLDDLLATLRPEPVAPPERPGRDVVPELPKGQPVTRPGQVWDLGPHRLICGDCTSPTVMAELLGGASPRLLLTDPPYCSGGFQESGRGAGSVGTDAPHKQIANDRLSTRGYMALMRAMLERSPAPFAYIFTDWRMWVNLFDAVESSGFGIRSMIVWNKGTPGMGRGWRSQHELVMWAVKETPPFDKHMAGLGNVIDANRTGNELHTTQKPVAVLERLLEATADFAPTILDPFAGSGSTLIAADSLNRTAYLAELDPADCDVICRRWQRHSGVLPSSAGQSSDFS